MPDESVNEKMQAAFAAVREFARLAYGDYYDSAAIIIRLKHTDRRTVLRVPLVPGQQPQPTKGTRR